MSIKATRKELKDNYTCIGAGYCSAQYLLKFESPTFYNCGTYGWNFDGYILTNSKKTRKILLTTGYRCVIHNDIIKDDYNIVAKYEQKARELETNSTREEHQKIIDDLIDEIINNIIAQA